MLLPYSALRPTVRSGDLVAWRHRVPHAFHVSLYDHVAIAWVIGGRILLLEADKQTGARISVASERLNGNCDLIRTGVRWTDSLEHWALSPVGRGYAYLGPTLAYLGFAPHFGEASSLYAACILKRAGVHLSEHGYTPQSLVDDLISMGDEIQRLDCGALGTPGVARIQILNSQGKPMTSASIPRDNLDTFPLSFLDASGHPVGVPADVTASTSDASIATAAIATADGADSLVVTPVANGSVTITVTSGSISATLDVTIVDPALASISIGDGTLSPIAPAAPVAG